MREINFDIEEQFLVPVEGTPIDCFNLLLDEVFLKNLVQFMNRHVFYVLILFFNFDPLPPSQDNKWKDLIVAELKTFMGLMLHTGTIKLTMLQDYWKKHFLLNLTCINQGS